ncbi:Starch-binding associating with outer membrane [Cyclobacterium xiamenense]|uniref:Starch-binding associating with outer membrane n=1 Tax=Cyclobacterium xiamenense TaxID=1297121 RepID=A0A1H6ZSD6_9BACT|nr:RagB/SusD family nutrient uptake outer membrane protein [Cyclobacterium xiamenense]SEJ51685.1 Starch-binding associating with outer membrane [Cyclobacterium xiamenense]
MKNLKVPKYIGIVLVALFLSCESILEPAPEGLVPMEDLFNTESNLITAVNGVYQPLHPLYQNVMFQLTDLASDDGWTWRKETEPDIYNVDPTLGYIQTTWSLHYSGITRANTVLDNLSRVQDFSSPIMENAVEGQAKFLRAFYYFNLVRLFGEVPLIINEIETRENAELPRESLLNIYAQIKSDLNDAIGLLPENFPGGIGMETGRATSNSARALLSAVHLELEEWSEAAQVTGNLVGKGSLLADYAANFNGSQENSEASFFEVQYGGVIGQTTTSKSVAFAPPDLLNGAAFLLPTDDNLNGEGGGLSSGNGLVQLFEAGDNRMGVIVDDYGLSNFIDPSMPDGSLNYVNKFYNTSDPRSLSTWNFPLIRYAEVLLNRAEALNELGYQADGEAFDLLNEIRLNAGLTALSSEELPNQEAFRLKLRDERRIELAFETKRYFDLNRYGIVQNVVQSQMDYTGLNFPQQRLISHPITGKDYFLYPLPAIEFVNNARLGEQNPGY